MATPNTPHHALFKAVFSEPCTAAAQFRALLPSALVAALDLAVLENVIPSRGHHRDRDRARQGRPGPARTVDPPDAHAATVADVFAE